MDRVELGRLRVGPCKRDTDMALFPQPPPPLRVNYTPSIGFASTVEDSLLSPFKQALDGFNSLIAGRICQNNPTAIGWITAQFLTIINEDKYSNLIPLIYPTGQLETTIAKRFDKIDCDVKYVMRNVLGLSLQPQPIPPAPPPIDITPVVAAVEESLNALKKEQASSLKSFSEAVKAYTPVTPPPAAPPPRNPSTPLPPGYPGPPYRKWSFVTKVPLITNTVQST